MALTAWANKPPVHKPTEAATPGYLPSPPNERELTQYVHRRIYWLIIPSLISMAGLTISQLRFATQAPWLYPFLLITAATLVYYTISLLVNFGTKDFDYDGHVQRVAVYWDRVKRSDAKPTIQSNPVASERTEDGIRWIFRVADPDIEGDSQNITRRPNKHGDQQVHYVAAPALKSVSTAPSVDVFMPVCGEPIEILRNSWTRIASLMYPSDRIRFFVLDDSRSDAIRDLAEEFPSFHYIRREGNALQKAGNMHHGYWLTYDEVKENAGEYIMVFDADFCPRPDMLKHLVPYMASDHRIGVVQSPQFFRIDPKQQNWLERGASAVQELFYRYIQQSREQRDAAICVGTNALYRREALAANGGPTQIGHSEDVHTGFDLRTLGWKLKFIPVNLATGTCPSEIPAFLAQQYRWCMGSMSLLSDQKFWVPSWFPGKVTWAVRLRQFAVTMTWRQRFSYFSGFSYYVMTALMTLVGPIIPLILLTVHPELVKLDNYWWILPSVIYTLVIFPLWHHCRYGLAAFATRFIYGWAHLFALVDVLRGTAKAWSPTGGKDKAAKSTKTILFNNFRLYATIVSGGGALGWVGLSLWRLLTAPHWYDFAPMLALGLFGLMIVAQALIPTWVTTFKSWPRRSSHQPLAPVIKL